MSKRAIIFHGTDCTPTDYWYAWLGAQLEEKGYEVRIPSYPDINREPIATFLPKVLQASAIDQDTVLVGHSAGGPLILSILENIDCKIAQAILVAGFSQPLPGDTDDPIRQETYDWSKIRDHVEDITFINSTNDPWGCDDKQEAYMFEKLGGTLIIRNDGHFGSTSRAQPYPEFPLLARLVL